jgi:predicted ATPase
MQQKIVLIGGPGTGKTTIIKQLSAKGFLCMPEISRTVILEAKKEGIEQLFLTAPLLFSEMLLDGREKQYRDAEISKDKIIFFDRGIPDVHAYMNYFNTTYPNYFIDKSNTHKYTKVFHFCPWKDIYTTDNERYETFEEAVKIDAFLVSAYSELGYSLIQVPFETAEKRTAFILESIYKE